MRPNLKDRGEEAICSVMVPVFLWQLQTSEQVQEHVFSPNEAIFINSAIQNIGKVLLRDCPSFLKIDEKMMACESQKTMAITSPFHGTLFAFFRACYTGLKLLLWLFFHFFLVVMNPYFITSHQNVGETLSDCA